MKKQLLFIIVTLLSIVANAQSTQSAVTLKNGTILQGVIKSIDPTKDVKMVIAGIETTVNMSDVAKIESIENNDDEDSDDDIPDVVDDKTKLSVTEKANYPESFDLTVDNQSIKMILVRGGDLNMGYDGRHSMKYMSEPMHKVKVTSFYISEKYIPVSIVESLVPGLKSKDDYYYSHYKFDNLQKVVDAVAKASNKPVRLPTEAEWEFAACCSKQSTLFNSCADYEICSDWLDDFNQIEYVTNPTGPQKGSKHVFRSYSKLQSKFDRSCKETKVKNKFIRLVIKAKDVK